MSLPRDTRSRTWVGINHESCVALPSWTASEDGTYFYYVHSYYVVPQRPGVVAIEAEYGEPFCAMIWRDNLFATQFHPEKSQAQGLRLLENFAKL